MPDMLAEAHALDVAEARRAMRSGRLTVFDVREQHERDRDPLHGSRSLPLSELAQRLGKLPDDRPIAFICQTGRRSAVATIVARTAGVDARNVKGGMAAWAQARHSRRTT
jgi:rhodanese-related sulfurtransferase